MADIIDLKFVTDTTGLDKAVTKSRSLEKRIIKLAKEVATGRITSDQYTKAVKKSATELQKLSNLGIRARKSVFDYSVSVYQAATASNKAAASTDNYSGSLNQLSASSIGATSSLGMLSRQAHQTKNKMNANGMAMQQLGYQTGDFIVQVQSGTNAWVAAGQQLTQLTGVLGMMNPAWIGIGAALGIVVPLVTAVGAAFSRSKSSADDLTTTLDELENAYSSIDSINDTLAIELVDTWADSTEGARNYLKTLRDIKQESVRAAGEEVLTAEGTGTVTQLEESIKRYSDLVKLGEKTNADPQVMKQTKSYLNTFQEAKDEFLSVFEEGNTTEESVIRILALREKYEASGGKFMLKRIDSIIEELSLQDQITSYIKKKRDEQKAAQDAADDALEEHATEMEAFYSMIAKEDKDEAKRKSDLMKKQWDALYKNRMEAKKAADEASKREATAIASSKVQIEQASVKQALQEAELQYGSKSIEHREAQVKAAKELARITAEQKFIADGITDAEQDQIDLLVEAAGEAEVMRQALADSKVEAASLAAELRSAVSALNSLVSLGDSIDKAVAVAEVRLGTLQITDDPKMAQIAATIEGYRQDIKKFYEKAFEGLSAETPEFQKLLDERFEANQKLYALEGYLELIEEENDRIKGLNKSGGKDKKSPGLIMTEELFAMKQKLDLQEASLGKSEEEILFEKNKSQLLSKITDQMVGMSEVDKAFYIQQAEGAARYITNIQEQIKLMQEHEQHQKNVADTIANSMGDALTSIVDGTKSVSDAFKDMARAIIAELYQIYVVKQITGMISAAINPYVPTFTPSENGNVFSNGNLVPYADGGVVGGPTYFPMNDGRTGLMGEAGPEAIMPLKRGKNGKLGVQADGGSGDVIIHQNFNFTANGDESVKKIIAQQAPAIANMTKKQILDDRRRGGQMKQAFG